MTTSTTATRPAGSLFATRRAQEARTVTTAAALLCGLTCLAALVPAVEHAVNLGIGVGLGLVALVVVVRLGARRLRERREDHADALTAARWRATHAPHLLTDHDRTRLAGIGHPAAVAQAQGVA
jgi:hypothetical protein